MNARDEFLIRSDYLASLNRCVDEKLNEIFDELENEYEERREIESRKDFLENASRVINEVFDNLFDELESKYRHECIAEQDKLCGY